MPAKLDLTPEQLLTRQRAQAVARNRRYRERLRERDVSGSREQGPSSPRAGDVADTSRSTAFLVTSLPSEEREAASDFERVRCVLEPVRGYAHNARHLARLAERFPDVDLVLEAIGMARWVNDHRSGNGCTEPFMTNWVKKAAARSAGPPTAPKSALGRVLQQIATDPVAGPSTWH